MKGPEMADEKSATRKQADERLVVVVPYIAWAHGARRAEFGEVVDDYPRDAVAQALRDGWLVPEDAEVPEEPVVLNPVEPDAVARPRTAEELPKEHN